MFANMKTGLRLGIGFAAVLMMLALVSRNPAWIRVNMPASLGKPFYPGS